MMRLAVTPIFVLAALATGCGTPAPASCDEMAPGLERDVCVGTRLKARPGTELDAVVADVQRIRDPMIKGEAIQTWVGAHANEIPIDSGTKLCNMLEGRDQSYCLRKLNAPHLQR